MTPELEALARRAVACRRWRWMPGMAGIDALGVPFRCALTHHSGGMMVVAGMAFMPTHPDALARMFPDLTDPATLGCLLALVREAWGQDTWVQHENEWTCFVVLDDQLDHYCGTSEAAALVAALEVGS